MLVPSKERGESSDLRPSLGYDWGNPTGTWACRPIANRSGARSASKRRRLVSPMPNPGYAGHLHTASLSPPQPTKWTAAACKQGWYDRHRHTHKDTHDLRVPPDTETRAVVAGQRLEVQRGHPGGGARGLEIHLRQPLGLLHHGAGPSCCLPPHRARLGPTGLI